MHGNFDLCGSRSINQVAALQNKALHYVDIMITVDSKTIIREMSKC